MSRHVPNPALRSQSAPLAAPPDDAIGSLMLRQRAEVLGAGKKHGDLPHGDKITDLGEIARILMGCLTQDKDDDDLVFELLMLETMLNDTPLKSEELLEQLGALGEEVREGMLPPGMINVAALRRRTRRIRQHLGGFASRVSAALLMFLTGLPFAGEAQAAGDDEGYAVASAPVVRVIDATSGQGMAGVQIKTMEERLLGVTDATGQATLAEGYMETDLLSLEKDGYEMYLLDRSQLSSRNIVSMKPNKGGMMAAAPAPGAHGAGAGHQPAASKPAAPKAPAAALKPPVPPKGPEGPKVAHGDGHGMPHMVAPKPPTKPAAPTIRLPVRPKPTKAAEVHARAAAPTTHDHVTPGTAHEAAPAAGHGMPMASPEVKLPSRPKAPAMAAAHGSDHAGPAHAAPAHKPAAHAPAAHSPAAHPPAAHKPVAHAALPSMRHAAPSAAHEATMALPARPRKPAAVADAGHGSMTRETPHVAIPRRMPRPRTDMSMASGGGSYYRVKPGDSLSLIAQRTLGSAKKWPQLYAANRDRVANPAFIRAGQTLVLPTQATGGSYVVKPGDCLFTIASSQLGSGAKWASIWQVNKDRIRDARFIYPGQVLQLPTA